nr:hypothetical protein [Mesoplasma seiffertii]
MRNQSIVPRGFIIFAQIIGTVIAVIGLIVAFYFINDELKRLSIEDPNFVQTKILWSIVLAICLYMVWKTVYTAIVICKFVKENDDQEIIANRYILAVLSLTLGGFLTPFVLTQFRNMETVSTVKPRWFLSRVLGLTMLVGGALGLGGFLLATLTSTLGASGISFADLLANTGGLVTFIILIALTTLGAIGVLTFYGGNKQEIFDGNTTASKLMNAVAIMFLVVATLELVWLIVISIIRLLGAIADLFQKIGQESGFMKAFAIMWALANVVFTFYYVMMIVRISVECIAGIWARDGRVVIKYNENIARVEDQKQAR